MKEKFKDLLADVRTFSKSIIKDIHKLELAELESRAKQYEEFVDFNLEMFNSLNEAGAKIKLEIRNRGNEKTIHN